MSKITFLIPYSTSRLQMETVPAIKISNFIGTPICDEVYAYLKAYSLNGALCCEMFRFEQAPSAQARMAIALCPASCEDKVLVLSGNFAQGELTIDIFTENGSNSLNFCGEKTFFSGSDEQGLYQCIKFCLTQNVLIEVFGSALTHKSVWKANVFSYDTREKAYGCAYVQPLSKQYNEQKPILGTMMPI